MKQKNLILVAVAVGCGLVAAFLTTQLGARTAVVEQYDVPVAAVDLPIGHKITKEELDQVVVYKKFNKDALPPSFVADKNELVDKRLTRNMRAGDLFNPQDLTTQSAISPPPGMSWFVLRGSPEALALGYAGPGSRVDVVASIRHRNSEKSSVFTMLEDMLVLAVGFEHMPGNQPGPVRDANNVSLAVTPDQAKLLHAATVRGAELRLLLRNSDKPAANPAIPPEEVWKILNEDNPGNKGNEPITTPKVEFVKIPVPTETLKAEQQLTAEVIEKKFKFLEVPAASAPDNVILNLKEHTGKYLLKEVAANVFIPRDYVGDKPAPKPEVAPMPAPKPEPEPKKTEPAPKPEKPKTYWDVTVQTSSGVETYRYEKLDSGEYKFLGKLQKDGTVKPAQDPKSNGSRPAGETL